MIPIGDFVVRCLDDEDGPWTVEHLDGRGIFENGQPVEFADRESAEAWAMVASAKEVGES